MRHLQPRRWDGWNGTCSVDGPSGVGAGSLLGGILSGGSVRPAVVSVVFVVFWWVPSSSRGSATGPPHPCQPSQAEPTFVPISKIVVAVQRQTQMQTQTQKKRRRHELEHGISFQASTFNPSMAPIAPIAAFTPPGRWSSISRLLAHSPTHPTHLPPLLCSFPPSPCISQRPSSAVPSTPPAPRHEARHPTDTTPHTLQLINPIPSQL